MGARKLTTKLKMIWVLLWAQQSTLVFQRHSGANANSLGVGQGDLRDMVLKAVEIKKCYNEFIDIINEMATHGGELHSLQALRESIDVLDKAQ